MPASMSHASQAPVEELVLLLTKPETAQEVRGKLAFHPSQGPVVTGQSFPLTVPSIETEELAWYLELFHRWPGEAFRPRAQAVEEQLPRWGQALYQAALDQERSRQVRQAWERSPAGHTRCFTVLLEDVQEPLVAAQLLALPWELLHNGKRFLFHGRTPVRVRRRLPIHEPREPLVHPAPLRVLFVSPRPEDERAGYIDHRVTALPVAETLAALGELAELTLLADPSFIGLVNALQTAEDAGRPFHVVHFDGHGIYLREQGLGALCFEEEDQPAKLFHRSTRLVTAQKLAERLAGYRIPLFFLEACQGAKAEVDPSSSVAATLLNQGVAAVVAMSHNVLVATTRQFVQVFYQKLAAGRRVGEAMLAGQQQLHDHPKRGHYLGAGELELQDWFVPVLYQEGADFPLVEQVPHETTVERIRQAHKALLGELPKPPPHHFVGRSRELLALERLLLRERYAVLLGEGGEGKTALACEAGRWLRLMQRVTRVAFVSLEKNTHWNAVVDVLGRQLVGKQYSVATETQALLPIEEALREKRTLLVLDNLETVLPPRPGGQAQAHDPEELARLLGLFETLQEVGHTRLLFTSRERLPAPFDAVSHHVDIGALDPLDGLELVKNVLQREGLTPQAGDDGEKALLDLVASVHGHARTLVLLAPTLASQGIPQTTENLHHLMASLETRHPGERERSLYAGVALSLQRLSPTTRQRIRPLGVFQGGGHRDVMGHVLGLEPPQLMALAEELAQTGLCDLHEHGYLTFHFALCPFLWGEMSTKEQADSRSRWLEKEDAFLMWLYQQKFQNTQLSASLTLLDVNNLLAGLMMVVEEWPVERAMEWATSLSGLLQNIGNRSAREQVARLREQLAGRLGEGGSHVRFNNEIDRVETLAARELPAKARDGAMELLQQCLAAGEQAYEEAGYDLAMAFWLAGRFTQRAGDAAQALPLSQQAHTRFQTMASEGDPNSRLMVAAALIEMGNCLCNLGRLEDAAQCYQQAGQEQEQTGHLRGVATSQFQLGTVRFLQRQYQEVLNAYAEARENFSRLQEPLTVASSWHQTGKVYEEMQAWPQAEDAYRNALEMRTNQNNQDGMADTLLQLGNLFNAQNRWEEAVVYYRKAVSIYVRLGNLAKEGVVRSNLADTLVKLNRLAEARQEIQMAIECKKNFGHETEPWKTWNILAVLETADNQPQAATQARRQARQLFARYRRDGGENYNPGAQLCQVTVKAIRQGQTTQARQALAQQDADDPQLQTWAKALIPVLLAILDGQRQPELVDREDLDYRDAVEVELLLEQLGE